MHENGNGNVYLKEWEKRLKKILSNVRDNAWNEIS
jgi:hypothetical protein